MNKKLYKKLLIDWNITEAQLAREIKVHAQRISDTFARRYKDKNHVIRSRVSGFFDVSEDILFGDEEEQAPCQIPQGGNSLVSRGET